MCSLRSISTIIVGLLFVLAVQSADAGEYPGGIQKGKGYGKEHGHRHHHGPLHGEAPPDAEVFESVAIRRVPLQRQTTFRIQQQTQQGQFESAALDDNRVADLERRLSLLESHVSKIYDSLGKLIEQLSKDSN